jgi:acyl-CoA dehydrogenase
MSETQLLREVARDVLEHHRRTDGDAEPWAPLIAGEWIGVGLDDGAGGAGGGLAEACVLAEATGLTGSAAPVVETVLAALLLGASGPAAKLVPLLATGEERATVVSPLLRAPLARGDGHVTFDSAGLTVPYGARCTSVVVPIDLGEDGGIGIALVPAAATVLGAGTNLAGEARDAVAAPEALTAPLYLLDHSRAQFDATVALLTAARTLGALRTAHALSLQHATDRRQFGRSIGSFQAVSHALVQQAAEVAQLEAAVAAALGAEPASPLGIVARVLADRSAATVSASAHQIHGAMGTTQEHALHRVSLRLMSWPQELGRPRYWTRRLGLAVAAAPDPWWDLVLGGANPAMSPPSTVSSAPLQ